MLVHIIIIVFSSSTQTPPDLGQSSTGFAHKIEMMHPPTSG
jgi:hypothetical protein